MSTVYKLKLKSFRKDVIFIFIIALIPFLIYAHLVFPKDEQYTIFDMKIVSGYYENVQTMFWVILMKLTYVIIFSVWYITNKHWWKPIVLFSLFVSCIQFVLSLRDEIEYIDKNEYWMGLLIAVPYLIIIVFLSNRLNYYSKSMKLAEELDLEIKETFEAASLVTRQNLNQIKAKVSELRSKKNGMTSEDYLKELIKMRDLLN